METQPASSPHRRRTQRSASGNRRLHREIEGRIRQYIEDQGLAPGAQLPTEAEFCQIFKVSRSTVRLALTRLGEAGLINRARGRGTFLAAPDQAGPPRVRSGARSPARPRSRETIGVVFSFASEVDVMQTAILRGVEHAVKSRGRNVVFGRSEDFDEASENRAIHEMLQFGVRGMVVMPIANRTSTAGARALRDQGVPAVLVDRYLSDLDIGYVVADNFAGAYYAAQHLILLGHDRFEFALSCLDGPRHEQLLTTSVRDRYAGYCQALRDYGLASAIREPVIVALADPGAVRDALGAGGSPPLAVVAVHDFLATELMKAAAQAGLRPPADFAIVGFDDLPIASHLSVPLTTILQPRYDIGFRAGHLLIDTLEGHAVRGDKLSLPVSLIVRESCGARRLVRQRAGGPAWPPPAAAQ